MTRVKMNARHEYEFIANYKVMQNVFRAKKIDKVRVPLPVSYRGVDRVPVLVADTGG